MPETPSLILPYEGRAVKENFITPSTLKALSPYAKRALLGRKKNSLFSPKMYSVHSRDANHIFTAKCLNLCKTSPYQHLKFMVLQQPIEQYK